MLYFILSLFGEADQVRIKEIYDLCQSDMLRYAAYFARCKKKRRAPQLEAEDIVQEVWLKISQNWGLIGKDWSPSQIRAYMLTAVKNEVLYLIGKQKQTETLGEVPTDDDFIERILTEERYQSIVAVIKAMDERYSVPLFFHFVQQRSIKEIATALKLPVKTVYTRVARGKVLLLKKLKGGEKNG